MMISNYLFLLLVVVLSAYPESPQHVNLPYSFPIAVAVYQNSSSAQLGVFTPVRPQNEVSINPPQYEVSLNPPQYEVCGIALPQNEAFETVLPRAVNSTVYGYSRTPYSEYTASDHTVF